jgi:hypothetical protein
MKILVKLPTRERPKQFLKALAKAIHNQVTKDVQYLVSYDNNDITFTPELIALVNSRFPQVTMTGGSSTGKIHACNRDVASCGIGFDILVLLSDDMICQTRGWDGILLKEMEEHYPDTDGVLWHNDGYTGNRLNTMCILGKKYYERFGYIYHPSYISLWSDNEFMEVAERLGKQTYFEQVLFRHQHPANTPEAFNDNLYKKNESLYKRDGETYKQRSARGFA